mmetsp:Transcript_22150/g.87277  ORF Transcript_22150/g.87277 Transcript_22150/m.87277 type:complete len:318 (-) Transcript_22150:81-1034(-)
MRAFERLAVEAHWHGEARAQGGDARGQVGQVDPVQFDLRTLGRRFGRLGDVDRRSGQRGGGVEVRALAARLHDAARRGVEAPREPDAERVLGFAGGFIPARLVEGQQLLEIVDAAAVVADLQGQHPGTQAQLDVDPGREGMLGHIGERLLSRPVGHQRHTGRQGQVLVTDAQSGLDAGAALEACRHPLQRGHQTLLEDGRAQVVHDALAGVDRRADRLQRRTDAPPHLGLGGMAVDPGQVELDRGQRAADIVMNLARDRRALQLDAGLQVAGELVQALLGLDQLQIRRTPGALVFDRTDRVQQRRRQAVEIVLQQIV